MNEYKAKLAHQGQELHPYTLFMAQHLRMRDFHALRLLLELNFSGYLRFLFAYAAGTMFA